MKRFTWSIAAIVALYFVGDAGVASTPDDSPNHRSRLHAKLTLADGSIRAVTLQGVGCPISMCSRVRARDTKASSLWLDGLASVSQISQVGIGGPVKALFKFKDGSERFDSVIGANRVLYLQGWFGLSEKLDLATVREISFI